MVGRTQMLCLTSKGKPVILNSTGVPFVSASERFRGSLQRGDRVCNIEREPPELGTASHYESVDKKGQETVKTGT